MAALNHRQLNRHRRDLLRSLGQELRQMREDAGRSQTVVASMAGIARSHLSAIEAGDAEPSVEVLMAVAAALGADLSVRLFPNTGPRIRDRIQVVMSEAFIGVLHSRWRVVPEVPVYRPIRGVIDLVLEDRSRSDTIASELHSQLRRVEQQVRWAAHKSDALAALPEHAGRIVSRLLVVRNTVALREVAAAAAGTLAAAYPARARDAYSSLTGEAAWPGAGILWVTVEHGAGRVLDGPPRGIIVGR